ncbi:hypothetical protein SBBP2_320021 [Burkholderiales bacterium]|nr:hypothetical protein SBBP2_320021 [Burkholderiales bacterium]
MAPALESGSDLELEPLDLVAGLAVEWEGEAELERADRRNPGNANTEGKLQIG